MKKTFKLIVFCLVAVLSLVACSTTVQDSDSELYINGHLISFDPAGGIVSDSELARAISESRSENEEIVLPVPERLGYTFMGWVETPIEIEAESSEKKESSEIANEVALEVNLVFSVQREEITEEKLYTAHWSPIQYRITYFDGGLIIDDLYVPPVEESEEEPETVPEVTVEEEPIEEEPVEEKPKNPESYNITQTVSFIAPTREGLTFLGWIEKPKSEVNLSTLTAEMVLSGTNLDYSIKVGTTGDKELVAVWQRNVHKITYDLKGGTLEEKNPDIFVYNLEGFELNAPAKDFYVFKGWKEKTSDKIYNSRFDDTFIDRDVELEAQWETEEYTLSYNLDDGKFECDYPVSYNYESETFTIPSPVKDSYDFLGWTDDNGNVFETITIPKNSFGDKFFTAIWGTIVYTIDYANAEEYGPRFGTQELVDDYTYPTRYTIEDVVNIRDLNRTGYDFMGWVLDNEEYTEAKTNLVLEKGSFGNRIYVPLYQLHVYDVILNMENGEINVPRTFTIEDENFTIGEPTRANYIFEGWLCEDGSVKNEVIVECANAQDVVLEALWTPIEYTINYDLSGGEYPIGSADNATIYNSDMKSFELVNPIKDSYEFAGWIVKGMENKTWPVVNYIFDTSNGGDVTLVATWKEKEYKISYTLDGGSFKYADSNPSVFTNFMDDIKLEAPIKDNYLFMGWVEVGNEGNRPIIDYIIKANELRTDIALKAIWTTKSYAINYNLNGGYFSRGVVLNPISYTIKDADFTLTNPVRDGYEFLGWVRTAYASTDIPSLTLNVDTSKGGSLSYDALWKANSYTITYNLDGGDYLYGNSNPNAYTVESSFTLANPHKDGYTFLGWIVSGDPMESLNETVTVRRGTTGNLVFYAMYEQTLVAIGEATRLQTEIVEIGKNDIPRPDWVIKAPEDSKYHYERAYASGSDLITNIENASAKCREYLASYKETKVSTVSTVKDGSINSTLLAKIDTSVVRSELVEYWEDANGGVWVLMRIEK